MITETDWQGGTDGSAVEAFRGSGMSDEQGAAMLSASVAEFDVTGERRLT